MDEDGRTVLESYAYLGLGTVVHRSRGNGVDLTSIGTGTGDGGDQYTGLDRFGRIVVQNWTDGTGSVDAYAYTYDRNGNRLSKSNLLNSNLNESYSYDSLNRLIDFTRADGKTQDWDLDALGNPGSVTTDGVAENRTHNSQNQLTKIGSTNLTYDANGTTTTDPNGRTLVYDVWNRLVEVKSGPTTVVRYEYDALNRRITENPGTERQLYYSAQWQVVEERNGSGSTTMQYVWSPVYIDAMVLRDRDASVDGMLGGRCTLTCGAGTSTIRRG